MGAFFGHDTDVNDGENELKDDDEARYTLYITGEKLQECPRIFVKIGGEEVSAILDTGCELTLMN